MSVIVFKDRARETTTDTGGGDLYLDGPVTGHVGLPLITDDPDDAYFYYYIGQQDGNEWEVGKGYVTAGSPNTLSRATVYKNHLGSDANVNFSAGTKDVFLTAGAHMMAELYDTHVAGSGKSRGRGSLTTSDNTPTAFTVSFTPSIVGGIDVGWIRCVVVARSNPAGGTTKVWEAAILVLDNAVYAPATVKDVIADPDTSGYDISLDIDGTDLEITVTGDASYDTYWQCEATVEIVIESLA